MNISWKGLTLFLILNSIINFEENNTNTSRGRNSFQVMGGNIFIKDVLFISESDR